MPLRLQLIKAPASIEMSRNEIALGDQGGVIGRADDNDLVLEDPDRYLSSRHCQFVAEGDGFSLIDKSTNGTFLNGSADPMGKGTKLSVKDQDTFQVGDYEFRILIDDMPASGDAFASVPPASPFDDTADDPFAASAGDGFGHVEQSPFASPFPNASPAFESAAGNNDPLAALDKAQGRSNSVTGSEPFADPFAGPTHGDGADPMNQLADWPSPLPAADNGSDLIPDDWDQDSLVQPPPEPKAPVTEKPSPPPEPVKPSPQAKTGRSAPAPKSARQRALEKASDKIQAEIDELQRQVKPKSKQPAAGAGLTDQSFVQALGLGQYDLDPAEVQRINELGGQVLREMITGLMQVLGSRSAIKNEFRMNVTTIQPVENNPLKFSANVDDALENMFIKQSKAYKKPLDAVEEGFQGVAEHQVAILAGIREAFKLLIQRFDPLTLEEKFSRQAKGGLLPGSQKARNWEAYVDYYQELIGDIDNSFQFLFGGSFVRAYEDQLQKLAISRKAKNKSE